MRRGPSEPARSRRWPLPTWTRRISRRSRCSWLRTSRGTSTARSSRPMGAGLPSSHGGAGARLSDALLFGLSLALIGGVFGSIALLLAQFTQERRTAAGMAGPAARLHRAGYGPSGHPGDGVALAPVAGLLQPEQTSGSRLRYQRRRAAGDGLRRHAGEPLGGR